ncbi:ADP-ribose-binding protein [Geovibrio thiophilus]|uniref:ADP-ribose-binding protein n=1 Tax=Geovibrio thiophilus TaxID=139438 RepID=A0A410JWZ6_9BACT|nr:ADP-ribose-binding protein [Geovibrio thiophilus]QAR32555.1 ADP-ribose-binding protein [Geovibrio thiophilus]
MLFSGDDLTELAGREYIAVTTNGTVKKNGTANMGRGNAKEVAAKLPQIAAELGRLLNEDGNRVHYLGDRVFSFPVEETWLSYAELRLVERSALELLEEVNRRGIKRITLPLPGCGKGGLKKADVLPVLEKIFDDRFVITEKQTQ